MKEKNNSIVVVLIYIVFFFILVFAISKKENYHVDEVFSYGLANHKSDGVASMKVKRGKIFEDPLKPYHKYMTVDKENCFDYKSVWENQKNDVHPPFYYVLLHTISSFFPGKFSRWFAGSINIGFALLTLFMVKKLVTYLTKNESLSILVSLGFVLNSGIISSTTFFRMYVITMFWGVLLAYLFLKLFKEGLQRKYLVSVFFVTVLAAMTHYYCIVYTVLMSVVLGVSLLIRRQWREIARFVVVMMLAAGASIAIFSPMINHMFFGYRGEEAIVNLQNSLDFAQRIKGFFVFFNVQLFGQQLGCLILIILFVGLTCLFQKKENNSSVDKSIKWIDQYVFLFVPILIYYFLISKMAAFTSDRYLFPVYAVTFVTVICCIYHIVSLCFEDKQNILLLCVLLALIVQGSWKGMTWPYLYLGTDEIIESLDEYSGVDCIFIYSQRFQTQYKYREIGCYDSVTFVKDSDLSKLPEYEDECMQLMVIINSENPHSEYLCEIMQKYPALTQYKEVVGAGEGKTYYCW